MPPRNNLIVWVKGLIAAIISGLLGGLLYVAQQYADGNAVDSISARRTIIACAVTGVILYLKKSPLTKMLVVVLLVSIPTMAQVDVEFTPERFLPELKSRDLYPWAVRMCSNGTTVREIPAERIYMASGPILVKDPARVEMEIAMMPKRSKKMVIAGLLVDGGQIAMLLTGFNVIAASKTVVASLGAGSAVGDRISKGLQARVIDPKPYLAGILDSPVTLQPGGCATRTVFSARMDRPLVKKFRVTIP